MADGFLGYPTSLMLDVVACALLVVVPLLLYSLWVVKVQRNYRLHKMLQVVLGITLLVVVVLFEVDMQMQGKVEGLLNKRSVPLTAEQTAFFRKLLGVHLVFAVSTVGLWTVTLIAAWRAFPSPPQPGRHSRWHKPLGWTAAIDITCTAITGLMVYYYGFVQ